MVCKHCGGEIVLHLGAPPTHIHVHTLRYRCDAKPYMGKYRTNGVKFATPMNQSDVLKALKKCIR